MTQTVRAIYAGGNLKLLEPLKGVKEQTEITVTLSDEAKSEKSDAEKRGWPKSFLETYGALADCPIERPPQGEFDKREPME